jgi:hypothetical protein
LLLLWLNRKHIDKRDSIFFNVCSHNLFIRRFPGDDSYTSKTENRFGRVMWRLANGAAATARIGILVSSNRALDSNFDEKLHQDSGTT